MLLLLLLFIYNASKAVGIFINVRPHIYFFSFQCNAANHLVCIYSLYSFFLSFFVYFGINRHCSNSSLFTKQIKTRNRTEINTTIIMQKNFEYFSHNVWAYILYKNIFCYYFHSKLCFVCARVWDMIVSFEIWNHAICLYKYDMIIICAPSVNGRWCGMKWNIWIFKCIDI